MYKYKLTPLEKIGFGAGDMAINVVFASMMLIITYFYTDVFGLKTQDLTILFIVVRLIDAVTDPLMGIFTDRVTTKWGRYRPYFLIFAIPFGLSIYLTFSTPDLDYNGKLVYAYATYIFVTIMFTTVTIPYISLVGVITDDPKERLSANGYRLFFAKVSAFLVTIIVPQLSSYLGQESIQIGYQYSMGIMGFGGALLLLFCFFSTTERVENEISKIPVKEQFKIIIKNDQWLVLCVACIVVTVAGVMRSSVAAYYAKYYLGGDAKFISLFLTTWVIGSICSMIASTWLTKKICKIALFKYSQILMIVFCFAMYTMVGKDDLILAVVLFFIVSFIASLYAPVFWSLISDTVDYGEKKTGKRVSGLIFGGISFSQKLGMGIAGAIVGVLLTEFNYVANEVQSDIALNGIAAMLTIIPGVFHLFVGLIMFKYKLFDKTLEGMKLSKQTS